MAKQDTTKPTAGWSPGDAEIRRLQEKTSASLLTLHNVNTPATTVVSNLFFEGSDFLWCTEGSFRFEFSDREPLVLHRGEFLVTFSNRFVTIVALEKSNALRGGTVVGQQNEEFFLRMGFWDCFVCRNAFSEYNVAQLQDLIAQRTSGNAEADFALLRYLQFILKSVLASLRSGRDACFYEAVQHINVNFLEGKAAVKALYSDMRCSPPFLIDVFKAHRFHGPSEYLYRLQSWWACRLLARTRLTIREIARSCGFSSSSSFTRFFKNWMGISPAEVRNGKPYRRRAQG